MKVIELMEHLESADENAEVLITINLSNGVDELSYGASIKEYKDYGRPLIVVETIEDEELEVR